MRQPNGYNPDAKAYYRPIEAAIRWSGLIRFEREILDMLGHRKMPDPDDFPKWPRLRLNTERLFDAIINHDLPCGMNGVTIRGRPPDDDPQLTVRHVDLKTWMVRFYPEHKPSFLFCPLERKLFAGISVDAVRAVLADRAALKAQLEHCTAKYQQLHREHEALAHDYQSLSAAAPHREAMSDRGEMTYLNIVGGLLDLLLGQSPAGHPYSSFRTQESVISALIAHHAGRLGISARTLQSKFAAARRHLSVL